MIFEYMQKCPIQLFAKESRLVEYPYQIFGSRGFRSLEFLQRKLYNK